MSDEFASVSARAPPDWDQWIRQNVRVDKDGVRLQTTPALRARELGFEATDIDLHPNGNISVLTPDGKIVIYVRSQEAIKPLTLSGYADLDFESPVLVGATSVELYVIDGPTGQAGAFSRRLRRLEWTADGFVDPVAVVGSKRRAYALDRGAGSESGFVRTLAPGGETAIVLDDLSSPLDLSVDPEETLYVLDEREYGPVLLQADLTFGVFADATELTLELPTDFEPEKMAAQSSSKFVFYGLADGSPQLVQYDSTTQTVESVQDLDQTWAQLVSGTVGTVGDARQVLLRSHWNQISLLEEGQTNQKDPATTRYEGRVLGRFDAGVRDVHWHRVRLEMGEQPPGTRFDVLYYANNGETAGIDDFEAIGAFDDNQLDALRAADVTSLWDLVTYTSSEISGVLPETPIETIEEWMSQTREILKSEFEERSDVRKAIDPEDMLLDEAEGRYLYIEVRLVGRRNSSPQLDALTAYCPRRSYTRYLPEIYREQDRKSPFLSEFLSIFESVFVDIETRMESRTQYLDPQEIPAEYLSWLDEWLGVDISDNWPESAKRELLERLPDLYKMSGTKRGIQTLVDLYLSHLDLTDPSWNPEITGIKRQLDPLVAAGYLTTDEASTQIEQYQHTNLGQPAEALFFFEHAQLHAAETDQPPTETGLVGHPRQFQLLLSPVVPTHHVQTIKRMVDAEKPAYTDADVERLQRQFLLDGHTYLGINTILQNKTFEIGMSKLGQETRIEPDGPLGDDPEDEGEDK
jgi:phage tail-like protein